MHDVPYLQNVISLSREEGEGKGGGGGDKDRRSLNLPLTLFVITPSSFPHLGGFTSILFSCKILYKVPTFLSFLFLLPKFPSLFPNAH